MNFKRVGLFLILSVLLFSSTTFNSVFAAVPAAPTSLVLSNETVSTIQLDWVASDTGIVATGGTVTYSGGNTIHSFTTSGNFVVTTAGDVEYLVIGGGGSGALPTNNGGGGGAAGAYRTATGFATTVQNYTITVGAGGVGVSSASHGNNGGDSTFSTITSNGGGRGGSDSSTTDNGNASEGGAGFNGVVGSSGAYGNDGGTFCNCASAYGGGGAGGSGGVGAAGSSTAGGAGGAGTSSSITGSAVIRAGGGGGGAYGVAGGAAGTGGASAGVTGPGGSNNATANTGSGSGGVSQASTGTTGTGGSGIVIISYPTIPAVTGYKIERNIDNAGWTTIVADTGTTAVTYTDTGLDAGTLHAYRVSGINSDGTSPVSNAPSTYTLSTPIQPTNLVATASSETIIGLDWDDAITADNLTGWRIFMESPVGNGWTLEVNDTGTTTSSYSDTGLTTKTQYNYMVAGINGSGIGVNSTASNDYTWGVPDAPTLFTIITPTVSTLTLNWTSSVEYDSVVTGVEIWRDNVLIDTIGDLTIHLDSLLAAATSYDYAIRSISSLGNSPFANATGITISDAPTGLTVNDCYHTCTTQLNLEWVAPVPSTGINGYRIFMETPIGNGFTTLVSNTTTTTLYYNDTGLTAGQFYNYKVAATTAGVISENSTAYAQSPHKLPDSVTDLVLTTNEFLQFLASWTQPNLYGTLTGYQINSTTPAGDPLTIYTSTNPGVTATISGLDPTVVHSIRVAANTYHGINATFGNIENGTLSSEIAVGNLTFAPGTNADANPIWFENYIVDSTTNDVQVRFSSALTVDCSITERIANNVNNYTSLSETAAVGYVYHNFTVTNAGNDILDWNCYDQTDATIDGQYSLAQNEAASGVGGVANIPLFSLMGNFTGGLYGTEGNFAGIDLITLFIVIVSMLGFNRRNPALGVGVMATMLGAAWYFELIPWTSGVLGGIAVVIVLAIGQGTKRD